MGLKYHTLCLLVILVTYNAANHLLVDLRCCKDVVFGPKSNSKMHKNGAKIKAVKERR